MDQQKKFGKHLRHSEPAGLTPSCEGAVHNIIKDQKICLKLQVLPRKTQMGNHYSNKKVKTTCTINILAIEALDCTKLVIRSASGCTHSMHQPSTHPRKASSVLIPIPCLNKLQLSITDSPRFSFPVNNTNSSQCAEKHVPSDHDSHFSEHYA